MSQDKKLDWLPAKPASQYTDQEILITPLFSHIKGECKGVIPDEALLYMSREAIRQVWNRDHPDQVEAEPDEESEDEAEEDGDGGELRSFDVRVEIPLTLRFKVEATSEDDAEKVAREELRKMRFQTWPQYDTDTEHFGVQERSGMAARGTSFDYPESPAMCEEMTVEES